MNNKTKNRLTVKLKSPNPLFIKWLTEWKEKAKEKGSKMEHTFNIAIKNLEKYPVPMESGRDCLILKGFGPKLCEMLDNKLKEHRANQVDATIIVEEPLEPVTKKRTTEKNPKNAINTAPQAVNKKNSPTKPKNKTKLYSPAYASGPYAIIITLLNHSQIAGYVGSSTKEEIIKDARALCNKSFTKPDPGTFYTAWSSMSNLITKKLIEKKGRPIKYNLTPEGEEVALRLISSQENAEKDRMFGNEDIEPPDKSVLSKNCCEDLKIDILTESTQNDKITAIVRPNTQISDTISIINQNSWQTMNKSEKSSTVTSSESQEIEAKCSQNSVSDVINSLKSSGNSVTYPDSQKSKTNSQSSSQASNFEQIIFAPGSFDVVLLVDNHEELSKKGTLDDETKYELNNLGVQYEIRHLKVGDFTWISRERETQQELVLPYVAERKRMDDLGHSIKDGRFHEQKFRLKQSGIQNLIYIVESFGNNTHTGLPVSSLMQGATNTLVQDGFQVKFTENHKHSLQYVAWFSLLLKKYYENKTLISCPRDDLQKHTLEDDLIPLLTFKDFNKSGNKQKDHTVKDLFVKHLVQLKGMSVEKALAIVEKYPTPRILLQEYEKVGSNGENLLTKIEFGPLKRTVGAVISKSIYQLYTQG